MPEGFFSILTAPSAFSSLCTSTIEGVSLCAPPPPPPIDCYCLLLRVRLLVGLGQRSLSFWAGLSLRHALRGGNFSVFLHPPCPTKCQPNFVLNEGKHVLSGSFQSCPKRHGIPALGHCRVPAQGIPVPLQRQTGFAFTLPPNAVDIWLGQGTGGGDRRFLLLPKWFKGFSLCEVRVRRRGRVSCLCATDECSLCPQFPLQRPVNEKAHK